MKPNRRHSPAGSYSRLRWSLPILLSVAGLACGKIPPIVSTLPLASSVRVPLEVTLEQLGDALQMVDLPTLSRLAHRDGLDLWAIDDAGAVSRLALDASAELRDVADRVMWIQELGQTIQLGLDEYTLNAEPYDFASDIPPRDVGVWSTLLVDPGVNAAEAFLLLCDGDMANAPSAFLEDWPTFAYRVDVVGSSVLVLAHHDDGVITFSHVIQRSQ